MAGVAVGIGAGLREFVAQIDEAMAVEDERAIVQGGADGAEYGQRFAPAARARPDVQRQDMLGAGLGGGAPVAVEGGAEGELGEGRVLRRVVEDAGRADEGGQGCVGRERGEDRGLEG